eukprot:TRINITY_DN745_c1_g1_i1.p1 TRINITY_DN745_c1_g1~~TRINITY_DN745_c1_g1_i1.p1  ORF type:complete len:336 (+),score=128.53 TRINITY_DN745_c1_g1_i1:323-1330(+)
MADRLAELRRKREQHLEDHPEVVEEQMREEEEEAAELEAYEAAKAAGDIVEVEEEEEEEVDYLEGFREDVNEAKEKIDRINEIAEEIRAITASAKDNSLQTLVKEGNELAKQVRKYLTGVKETNTKLEEEAEVQGGADLKIRINFHRTLTRELYEAVLAYNNAQRDHQDKYVEKVSRQAMIVNPDVTEEEVYGMIENGKGDQLFADFVLMDQNKMDAADGLQYMQEQYRDLMELYRGIIEVHQLMVEIAVMVEAQGELLDQIEYNTSNSVYYTGKALRACAKKERNAIRKRKACCAACACCALCAGGGGAGVAAAGGPAALLPMLAPLLACCTVM